MERARVGEREWNRETPILSFNASPSFEKPFYPPKWRLCIGLHVHVHAHMLRCDKLTVVNLPNLFKHIPQLRLWRVQGVVPDDNLGGRIVRPARHPRLASCTTPRFE